MTVLTELAKTIEDDELRSIRFASIDGVSFEGVVRSGKLKIRKRSTKFVAEGSKYDDPKWTNEVVSEEEYVSRVNDARDQLISRLRNETDLTVERV